VSHVRDMKPEVKTKWVEALRSGKYKQAEGVLRDEDGSMCCLGVLCDILAPEGWKESPFGGEAIMGKDGAESHWLSFGSAGQLPDLVADLAGVDSDPSLFEYDDCPIPITCSSANDDYKKTFAEIADLIEAA
jgi:hypothetical protein